MAYEDRQSGAGGAAVVVLALVVLLGGILVLAVGAWFFLRVSTVQRQVVIEQDRAIAAQKNAERLQFEAELERDQVLAESDPDESNSATVRQLTIAMDKDGNASVDGNSMQLDELQSQLRTMSDESSGQLSVVVQVEDQCRFEHVARILSLCEEAGIEKPKLESSGE